METEPPRGAAASVARRPGGDRQLESRAAQRRSADDDVTAVRARDPAQDRQPEPEAVLRRARFGVAGERVEDPLAPAGGYAPAGVVDRHDRATVALAHGDAHRQTRLRELEGVRQEVAE